MPTNIEGQPYYVNALLFEGAPKWTNKDSNGTTVVTYSYMTKVPDYYSKDAPERATFVTFNGAQEQGASDALALWSRVANITFTPVSDDGDGGQIRFGTFSVPKGKDDKGNDIVVKSAYAIPPTKDSGNSGGDLWLNNDPDYKDYSGNQPNLDQAHGSFGFFTLLHEIGHALGLSHPGPYDAGTKEDKDAYSKPNNYLSKQQDNWQYSLMSYNDGQNGRTKYSPPGGTLPQTPLLYDIAAMQYLYGANTNANAGDNTYDRASFGGGSFLAAIWDAGGIDTIDASDYYSSVSINLQPGSFSSIGGTNNLALAFEVRNSAGFILNDIENAIGGSGNDTVIGNASFNNLKGGAGNDTIEGGAGFDDLYGDEGNDVLYGGDGPDPLLNLTTDFLYGGSGDDRLYGGEDDDFLYGGSGIDYLYGENGSDHLIGDSGNDFLYGGLGVDVLYGYSEDDYLDGGDGDDSLSGNDGNDVLDGGSGDDILYGADGDDVYIVDSVNDKAVEYDSPISGIDKVESSVSFTLGDRLENLVLTGDNRIVGYGNSLDNVLTGNDANNALVGAGGDDTLKGGGGADFMRGGIGNDTYYVDSLSDTVIESSREGIDSVYSFITYTLGDDIENLLLHFGSDNAFSATGNSLSNTISGNLVNNTLSGQAGDDTLVDILGDDFLDGGTGDDRMLGGAGNDTYIVDSAADTVTEYSNGGVDIIYASVNYDLSDNVERIIFTGSSSVNSIGNNLDNTIVGNDSGNSLSGMGGNDILIGNEGDDILDGGLGNDSMSGGLGNDIYYVDSLGDLTTELSNEGTDTVYSSASYSLSSNLENLSLTGNDVSNATGNNLSNSITGNVANNYLYGAEGDDTLDGGAGDDWLSGDAGNDSLSGASGKDWLIGGWGNDSLSGGEGIDRILGGLGDDSLSGDAGKDWLRGGVGADTFIFNSFGKGVDTIEDFRSSQSDRIVVSAKGFARSLKTGKLSQNQFALGSSAHDAGDRFIYNPLTGQLFFDLDGTGSRKQIQFAQLSPKLALSSKNIQIIA